MASQDAPSFEPPPGADQRRRRHRVRFELLGCAWNGHRLVGTDAASTGEDDALVARPAGSTTRWYRCLRCDSWSLLPVPDAPTRDRPAGRDEIVLPARGGRSRAGTCCA